VRARWSDTDLEEFKEAVFHRYLSASPHLLVSTDSLSQRWPLSAGGWKVQGQYYRYDDVVQEKQGVQGSLFVPWLDRVCRSPLCPVLLWVGVMLSPATALPQEKSPGLVLEVDATTIPRKILSARESFPVASPSSHTVDLVYPKWIPGNHAPTGPIADLVNLRFSADGNSIPWTRDPVDMYRFHISVPAGTTRLMAEFSLVGAYIAGNDFAPGNTSTPVQGDVNWDQLVLYPADTAADQITVTASIRLPDKWSYATALPHSAAQAGTIRFDPVSLTTLIDSPLMCGSIMREFDITPKGVSERHLLDIFEESPEGLNVPAARIAAYRNLVSEARTLFRSHHYGSYHFLVEAQSENSDGLEHHESSDEQVPTLGMVSSSFSAEAGDLLAHEMIHSWNGKFRRPAGLATPDYQQPMIGDLLWVYEGLTSYWAEVLATRSGLVTKEQAKDRLALYQAEMDARTGRSWRNLQDVSRSAQLLYSSEQQWTILRRSTDFYREGPLLWLQVDGLLREQSKGTRSLDTFAAEFFGPPDGAVAVKPYTYDDLVAALNHVAAFNWNTLFQSDLLATRPKPVSPGLEAAGWTVVYNDEPNRAAADMEITSQQIDLSTSIGLVLDQEGTIVDIVPESAAGRAGLAPAVKVVGVNHRVYSAELLREAIVNAETTSGPINLLTISGGYYAEFSVDYHQGLRSPHLIRITGKPDLLATIFAPRRSD
jgi:predicted metalloprotease with PDZ domain